MKVELIQHTPQPLEVIYASGRQCYSHDFTCDKIKIVSRETMAHFVQGLVESGHESPLEHVSFTFAVEGISRACSHQLVRHRIASYSQQSQRYVKEEEFEYITPPHIAKKGRHAVDSFKRIMNFIDREYNKLLELGVHQEDARYILPNACETKIVLTMNARVLKHFFAERLCTRSQWEIRALASRMFALSKKALPEVFTAGAKCFQLGYCPESEKFACGIKERLANT